MRKRVIVLLCTAAALLESRAVASDFATSVVDADANTMIYGRPENALGRPTVDEPTNDGPFSFAFDQEPIPVVPVYNAFSTGMLATVKSGGYLTLAFDHPVEDEALNPYGIDFIVFGNAFMDMAGDQEWTNGHPSLVQATAIIFREPGLVSVSQDGTTWLSFTNGPYADDFPPTLGRQLNTNAPDTSLGSWNGWWGAPTDPTLPLPPDLNASDLSGHTIEELALLYGRSAGGVGFDLSGLDLPTNSAGRKWIQYVKIEPLPGQGDPEVDALSDVAPVTASQLWVLQQFNFFEQTNSAMSGMEADPDDDGLANLLEYALGSLPRTYTATNILNVIPTSPLQIRYTPNADADDVIYTLEASPNLDAWSTNGFASGSPPGVHVWTNSMRAASFRLRIELVP